MEILELFLVIAIGLSMGSFITMAAHRFSLEGQQIKALIFNRSHCPKCKKQLGAKNLVPFFSWMVQRGKCSFCQGKISIRYPLIEVFTTATFVAIYFVAGREINPKLILMFLIATMLIIAIITDLEGYFIPDIINFAAFLLAGVFHWFFSDPAKFQYYFLSAVSFFIFGLALYWGFLFFTKKDGIGFGDVKFFGVAGFLLGYSHFPIFMFFSGFFGIIFGLIWRKITGDKIFPFAPALIVSLVVSLLVGDSYHFFKMLQINF